MGSADADTAETQVVQPDPRRARDPLPSNDPAGSVDVGATTLSVISRTPRMNQPVPVELVESLERVSNPELIAHARDVQHAPGDAVRRRHYDEGDVGFARGCRELLQESQSAAVEEFNRAEIDDDAVGARGDAFNSCSQPLGVRNVDLPAQRNEDAPVPRFELSLGRGHSCPNGSAEWTLKPHNRTGRHRLTAEVGRERPHDGRPASSITRMTQRRRGICRSRGPRREIPPLSLCSMSTRTSPGSHVTVGVLNRVRTRFADRKKDRVLQGLPRPLVQPASLSSKREDHGALPRAPETDDGTGRDGVASSRTANTAMSSSRESSTPSLATSAAQTSSTGRSATVRAASASLRRPTSIGSLRRSTSPSE